MSPVLQDRKPAVGGGLRRGVEDRRRARGAGLPAVADAGQRQDAAFDQRRRRLHVDDLGAAGIADRPGAADEQHAVLVDVERGIVDPVVIILRPLEHDGAALERVQVFRIDQIAVAEFLRDHAGLHDRGIEQIAAQHQEAGVLHQRLVVAPDHVAVGFGGLAAVLAHGAAVDGDGVFMDALVRHQFAHHRRHAAGAMIFLAEIEAGRLHVHQQRDVVADVSASRRSTSSTPIWRASALMWIGALVEPPIAELTTMQFSNALRVRMSEGFRSSHTISTMRLPVS